MADDIITVKSLNLWYGTDGKPAPPTGATTR